MSTPTPSSAGKATRGWDEFNAVFERRDLMIEDKAVYLFLWRKAGPKMRCWPSQRTIAEAVSIRRESVNHALARLKAKKLLLWYTEPMPGQGRQNVYHLLALVHWLPDSGPAPARGAAARAVHEKGDRCLEPDNVEREPDGVGSVPGT